MADNLARFSLMRICHQLSNAPGARHDEHSGTSRDHGNWKASTISQSWNLLVKTIQRGIDQHSAMNNGKRKPIQFEETCRRVWNRPTV
jgi:hypothetical protein